MWNQDSGFCRAHRSQDCQSCPDSGDKSGEPQKDSYFKSDTKLKPLYSGLKQSKKRERGQAPLKGQARAAFLAECQKENTWLYRKRGLIKGPEWAG